MIVIILLIVRLQLCPSFCFPDLSGFFSHQEPFEDGLANGEEPSAAEEAAALAAKEAKGGSVKFGWVKGVLVSVHVMNESTRCTLLLLVVFKCVELLKQNCKQSTFFPQSGQE